MEACPNYTNIRSRKGWERMYICFSLAATPRSCVCLSDLEEGEAEAVSERKSLMKSHVEQVLRIKDVVDEEKTLAFHLEPKVITAYKCFTCRVVFCVYFLSSFFLICRFICFGFLFFVLWIFPGCDFKGINALQWVCKKSGEAHLKDGR